MKWKVILWVGLQLAVYVGWIIGLIKGAIPLVKGV